LNYLRIKEMGLMAEGKEERKPESKDEIALELMKFIAVTTGYGKGATTAGFAKGNSRSPEEYAEALLQLFERCRSVVAKQPN
jgi:ATP:corrinoid adenosyltransferase